MAAVSLETTELETLVESALNNPNVGMQLLNALRVKNGKAAYPDNFGRGDVTSPHDAAWRTALTGVQADLNA
ncbi:hypothetical protein HUT19_37650 [Streptomyces sp. NA02950]|uniref:hypothetical protein n=1 Tax=Streptomyces sp. NA02950 TaxID=2742137 RepID=UPI0015928A07|nr:hypothetical protein [Streptomyces sp. NA02950]QKV96720.1 hypothetical protein HUT19_37650 [Streptomyces sp. NA02950]